MPRKSRSTKLAENAAEDTAPPPKKAKAKHVRGKRGALAKFIDLPLDVLDEVCDLTALQHR